MNRALSAPQLWRGCRKLRFQNPFRAGPRAGSRPRPPQATIADFAPALIATKPVKPCDGGVFWALNSLLISERIRGKTGWIRPRPSQARTRHKTQPNSNPARSLPQPNWLLAASLSALSALRLRNEPGFVGAPTVARLPQAAFSASVPHGAARRFLSLASPRNHRQFRSCFDSGKARQTVRWRRFWGLEFAPDFRADTRQNRLDSAQAQPSPNPAQTPTRTQPQPNWLLTACLSASSALCLRNEPGFAASKWQCGRRKPFFSKPVQREDANRFCRRPCPEKRRLFRSCFDSNKACQTVRWRRFWGLEFAPDFKAASGWTERARPKPCAARAFGSVRFTPGW